MRWDFVFLLLSYANQIRADSYKTAKSPTRGTQLLCFHTQNSQQKRTYRGSIFVSHRSA